MLPSLKLRDLFVDTARENDIPVQFDVLSGYGEDGAEDAEVSQRRAFHQHRHSYTLSAQP